MNLYQQMTPAHREQVQVGPNELVGNTEQAVVQSSAITERS